MARTSALLSALAALTLLASACGGSAHSIEVLWKTTQATAPTAEVAVQDMSGSEGSPLETVVYVRNNSSEVLHSAELRLSEEQVSDIIGFSVGTITSARTDFRGTSSVWSLGDLKPGAGIRFPIGLFFSARYPGSSPSSLALTVELASPDLAAPVRSNALSFSLRPSR